MLNLPLGTWLPYIEPLNIIKNYYGEKYALFFAFLAHHIAMLFYLIPGALLEAGYGFL
jgi:hypothetical protein